MVTVAKLNADLTANTSRFEAGMNRAAGIMGRTRQKMGGDVQAISRGFEFATRNVLGLNGALAGIIGGTSLTFLAKNSLQAADGIAKLADRLGLTTTEVQRYDYAMKLAGVTTEQMETAFGFLNRQIAEGKLPYKNINQALADLAERTINAKDGIERARIASEAFGAKAGARLIPFLLQGKEGIRALGDEAERLGIVLDQTTIRAAEEFKDQLEILGSVIARNFQQGLLDGFVSSSQEIRDIYTDPAFIEGIKGIGEAFGGLARFVMEAVKAYQEYKVALAALGISVASKFNKDSPFAIDPEVAQYALEDAGNRMQGGSSPIPKGSSGNGRGSGGSLLDEVKNQKDRLSTLEKINDQLTKESVLVDIQVQNYGQKDAVIKSATRAKEIELELAERGIVLTEKEREQLQAKLDMLRQNSEQLEQLTEQQKKNEQIGQQLGFTFSSAFEDAIVQGKSFREVLKSIADDILRLFLRTQITGPASQGLGGLFSGGGGLSGILGGLFGGFNNSGQSGLPWQSFGNTNPGGGTYLGSFASGLDYVPSDGMANIHRGEAVLNEQEAADWRAGGGGSTYYIDATGASNQSITELKALIMSLAGPGRVEQRVFEARRRGQPV